MTRDDAATIRLAAQLLHRDGKWKDGAKLLAAKLTDYADRVDEALDRVLR